MRRPIIAGVFLLWLPLLMPAQERSPAAQVRDLMDVWKFGQAADLAERFLSADSTNTELFLLRGRSLAALSKYPEAIRSIGKALASDSTSLPVLNELIQVYRQSGNITGALRTVRTALVRYPGNSWLKLQQANLLVMDGDYRDAVPLLQELYRGDSASFHLPRQLGTCYFELKKADSAIRFYRRALKLSPYDEYVTGRLVNLFIRTDQVPIAYYFTQKYLEKDSTSIPILRQNGYCLYLMIDFPGAARQLGKCLAAGDSSKFTLKYLGLSCYKRERYDSAAPFFRAAFRNDTTDSELCFYYGVSAFRAGQNDTGRVYLERTFRLLMPSGSFLSSLCAELADAGTACGNPDTAVVLLRKALEADPGNNTLRFRIAYQYDYHLRKPFEALPWYREFL
ncbi:MAG TPA: tetratricopeptide repeat protein [Bacteroidales bacterium]|nr:tetratricopeptide repeat protein [Bacteroidales bacterium]